ncbi:tubby C-terminal-like domain-containing protein [Cladochytrium replicatum]|nr:tubby C-terminal-like domain-containing protein [Cladochytrium replicatum]
MPFGLGSTQHQNETPVPQYPPLPVFSQYVRSTPTTLQMKEAKISFSGDDFKVLDATTGDVLFKVDGKLFSIGQKKVLLDGTGNKVGEFRHRLMTLTKTFEVECFPTLQFPTSSSFTIESEITFASTKMMATIPTRPAYIQDTKDPSQSRWVEAGRKPFVLKADWRSKNGNIFLGNPKAGGQLVAKIYRPSFTVGEMFFDAQTYHCEVAPGIDLALIAMLLLALDEKAKD